MCICWRLFLVQSVKTPALFGLRLPFQRCLTKDTESWCGSLFSEDDHRVPIEFHEKLKGFCKKTPVKSSYSTEAGNHLLPQHHAGVSMEAWDLPEDGVWQRSLVCRFLKISGVVWPLFLLSHKLQNLLRKTSEIVIFITGDKNLDAIICLSLLSFSKGVLSSCA